MRFLCFLFLLAFAGAAFCFAQQNQQDVTLTLFNWTIDRSMALVIGAAYLLGMLSGWTVVGMLRRSFHRATEWVDNTQPASVAR